MRNVRARQFARAAAAATEFSGFFFLEFISAACKRARRENSVGVRKVFELGIAHFVVKFGWKCEN